jgi:hypothetical protein
MRDQAGHHVTGTARHGRHGDAPVRLALAAATVVLLGVIAACSSGGYQPPARVQPAIPAQSSAFAAIPAACSLMSSRALSRLGLAAKGQQQPSAQETGLTEEYCTWTARPGNPVGPTLTVVADLYTANPEFEQTPAAAAQQQFPETVSNQAQADDGHATRVGGLASGAFIEQVTRGNLTQSQVQVLDQNVLLNIAYGEPASSESISAPVSAGALTAASAVLATLRAS